MTKALYIFAVFTAGVVAAGNLVGMLYGVPPHYDAAWWKLVAALLVAIVAGGALHSGRNF